MREGEAADDEARAGPEQDVATRLWLHLAARLALREDLQADALLVVVVPVVVPVPVVVVVPVLVPVVVPVVVVFVPVVVTASFEALSMAFTIASASAFEIAVATFCASVHSGDREQRRVAADAQAQMIPQPVGRPVRNACLVGQPATVGEHLLRQREFLHRRRDGGEQSDFDGSRKPLAGETTIWLRDSYRVDCASEYTRPPARPMIAATTGITASRSSGVRSARDCGRRPGGVGRMVCGEDARPAPSA